MASRVVTTREADLRSSVAKTVRRRIDQPLWDGIRRLPEYDDALRGDPQAVEEVVKWTKEEIRGRRNKRRRLARAQGIESPHEATRLEIERGRVIARHWARLALRMRYIEDEANPIAPRGNRRPGQQKRDLRERGVLPFRERYLSGSVLSPQEAADFLDSAALRYLKEDRFARHGLPFVNAPALLLGTRLAQPTQRPTAKYVWPPLGRQDGAFTAEFLVFGPPRQKIRENHVGGDLDRTLHTHSGRAIEVYEGTVLDHLRDLATKLSRYLPWHEAESCWFVLTGTIPSCAPLETRVIRSPTLCADDADQGLRLSPSTAHRADRIAMVISPWLSADAVRDIYLKLQRQILRGNQNKRIGADKLKFFEFVAELREKDTPWRECRHQWNRKVRKKDRYGDEDHPNFHKDYHRIYRQIVQLLPADKRATEGVDESSDLSSSLD
jgi:hypothetical protein